MKLLPEGTEVTVFFPGKPLTEEDLAVGVYDHDKIFKGVIREVNEHDIACPYFVYLRTERGDLGWYCRAEWINTGGPW